ncbi:hypothetical protein ACF3M1_05080 [Luteimonas sp. WGS1318]|uniref:hypothetical protein n=1 Tax=Luteimonas sp. WGS1318 TaxID=3366815 RepID=UPI00372D23C9
MSKPFARNHEDTAGTRLPRDGDGRAIRGNVQAMMRLLRRFVAVSAGPGREGVRTDHAPHRIDDARRRSALDASFFPQRSKPFFELLLECSHRRFPPSAPMSPAVPMRVLFFIPVNVSANFIGRAVVP